MTKLLVGISILVVAFVATLGVYQAKAESLSSRNVGGSAFIGQTNEFGGGNKARNVFRWNPRDADTGPVQTLYSRPYSRTPSNFRYEP